MTENGGNGMFNMPVVPAYGGGGGFGGGMFGADGWWIILLLLVCGGWGNGFGGNGGGFGGGGGGSLYPWLNNSQHISDGFRDQTLQTSITGLQNSVTSGFGDVQNALCSGFAGVNATVNGAQNAIAQQLYTNEIANLNRSFAEQTANTAGFNGVQASLCDIRYGSATNTRDIIDSQTRGTQVILDKLCSLELDNYRRENDQLRTQLNMANLVASQTAQTAQIRDGQLAATTALVNELRSCPIPSQPVYGSQPIFTCQPNYNGGCGCGCGNM